MKMNDEIKYAQNHSTTADVYIHLKSCDNQFVPHLSSKVELAEYSKKIADKAIRFEAWNKNTLVGLVAAYFNQQENFLYITNVSVEIKYKDRGIAKQLLHSSIIFANEHKLNFIELEVNKKNQSAINLYKKLKFENLKENTESYFFTYKINRNEQ